MLMLNRHPQHTHPPCPGLHRRSKKHGWAYSVDEPNQRRTARQKRFAAYGDNYSTRRKGLPDLTHLPSMRQGK